MNLNVNLRTSKEFQEFFNWAGGEAGTMDGAYNLLMQCGFPIDELFNNYFDENMELDEPLEETWKEVPEEYLGDYHINIDDSFDRMGDVKRRYVIKLDNILNVSTLINRHTKIEKERRVIAKKYDQARVANDYNLAPSKDEMNKMSDIEDELSRVYGIG